MHIARVTAAIVLLGLSAPARADADLREQLAKPVVGVLNSAKVPSELQLCAADAIGNGLLPLLIPADASGTVHIFGFAGLMGPGTVQRVVSLVRTATGTRIEVRTRSARADEGLVALLRACV